MKRAKFLLGIVLFLCFVFSVDTLAGCYTIAVGKKASASGRTIVAHNEDDDGNLLVNIFKVNPNQIPLTELLPEDILSFLRPFGFIPQEFLWMEIPQMEFADSYLNGSGVLITSNACPSKEDQPAKNEEGIGYYLRRAVALYARDCEEALRIIALLVERFGYNSSGRTYTIADSDQIWLVSVVFGRHWVARRVPDNLVVVLANRYIIGEVNLQDRNNFRGSSDLIGYARRRGWFRGKEKEFNFARVYGNEKSQQHPGNYLRQWQGVSMLSNLQFKPEDNLPFAFKPSRPLSKVDLIGVLRNHYEDSVYHPPASTDSCGPHFSGGRTICADTTKYSFVAEFLPRNELLPALIFWSAGFPCQSPFNLLFFSPAGEVFDFYQHKDLRRALSEHFQQPERDILELDTLNFVSILKLNLQKSRNRCVQLKNWQKMIERFEAELFADELVLNSENLLRPAKKKYLDYLFSLSWKGELWRLLMIKNLFFE